MDSGPRPSPDADRPDVRLGAGRPGAAAPRRPRRPLAVPAARVGRCGAAVRFGRRARALERAAVGGRATGSVGVDHVPVRPPIDYWPWPDHHDDDDGRVDVVELRRDPRLAQVARIAGVGTAGRPGRGAARGPRRGLPLTVQRRGATFAGQRTAPGTMVVGLRAELDATPPAASAGRGGSGGGAGAGGGGGVGVGGGGRGGGAGGAGGGRRVADGAGGGGAGGGRWMADRAARGPRFSAAAGAPGRARASGGSPAAPGSRPQLQELPPDLAALRDKLERTGLIPAATRPGAGGSPVRRDPAQAAPPTAASARPDRFSAGPDLGTDRAITPSGHQSSHPSTPSVPSSDSATTAGRPRPPHHRPQSGHRSCHHPIWAPIVPPLDNIRAQITVHDHRARPRPPHHRPQSGHRSCQHPIWAPIVPPLDTIRAQFGVGDHRGRPRPPHHRPQSGHRSCQHRIWAPIVSPLDKIRAQIGR